MSSFFFQISGKDFLEAAKIYDNPGKHFALRIITFQNGKEHFIYLPDVTLNELSILASILKLKILPTFKHYDDLKRYIYGTTTLYYYY